MRNIGKIWSAKKAKQKLSREKSKLSHQSKKNQSINQFLYKLEIYCIIWLKYCNLMAVFKNGAIEWWNYDEFLYKYILG